MRFNYPTPEEVEKLYASARRERAIAMHKLVIAPIVRFIAKAWKRPEHLRESRWIAANHSC